MELFPIDFVFHIVNMIVLFVIVRNLAYKPVRKFMLAREERIQAQLDEAAQAQANAKALEAKYAEALSHAEEKGEAIIAEGHAAAVRESHELIDAAKAEAETILRAAREAAEAEAGKAMGEARVELANSAVELAGRVLCFNEAAKNNAMSMNTALQGETSAIIRVPGEISEGELEEVRCCLQNLTGKHIPQIEVRYNEKLLGGFVGYVDGQVYDFSYLAQLQDVQRKLS